MSTYSDLIDLLHDPCNKCKYCGLGLLWMGTLAVPRLTCTEKHNLHEAQEERSCWYEQCEEEK